MSDDYEAIMSRMRNESVVMDLGGPVEKAPDAPVGGYFFLDPDFVVEVDVIDDFDSLKVPAQDRPKLEKQMNEGLAKLFVEGQKAADPPVSILMDETEDEAAEKAALALAGAAAAEPNMAAYWRNMCRLFCRPAEKVVDPPVKTKAEAIVARLKPGHLIKLGDFTATSKG